MRYVLDTHTHSIASGHSYSTIREMAYTAKEKGVELLGITEHGPAMPGSCHDFYFMNLRVVSRNMCGVELLLGAEVNIMDFDGRLDLNQNLLERMDVVIASLHIPCLKPGSRDENTRAYIEAMKNPFVNIIGHPDDIRYPFDYDALIYAVKEQGKLIEINNASLNPFGARRGARENQLIILEKCKEYQVPVLLSSDAHVADDILNFGMAEEILEEVRFPKELVLNDSVDKLKKYVNKYNK